MKKGLCIIKLNKDINMKLNINLITHMKMLFTKVNFVTFNKTDLSFSYAEN